MSKHGRGKHISNLSGDTNNYYSYDNSAVIKKKKVIVPRKMSPKQIEKASNYSQIHTHEKEMKYTYAKAPKLSARNIEKNSEIGSSTISKKSKEKTPKIGTSGFRY